MCSIVLQVQKITSSDIDDRMIAQLFIMYFFRLQTNNSTFSEMPGNPGVTNPTDKQYIGFGNNTLSGDSANMWSANQGERNPPGTSTYRGGVPPKGPTLYNPDPVMPCKVTQLCFHWFYKIIVPQRPNPLYLG